MGRGYADTVCGKRAKRPREDAWPQWLLLINAAAHGVRGVYCFRIEGLGAGVDGEAAHVVVATLPRHRDAHLFEVRFEALV